MLVTNTGNTYSGLTTINNGTVEITNASVLGTSNIVVNRHGGCRAAQRHTDRGRWRQPHHPYDQQHQPLRSRSELGRRRCFGERRGQCLHRKLRLTSSTSETRLVAAALNTTISGGVTVGAGQSNIYYGDGNFILTGVVSGGTQGVAGIDKLGSGLTTGTLVLANAGNTFAGDIRIDSGTIRVADGGALGVGTSASSIRGSNRPPRGSDGHSEQLQHPLRSARWI